MPTPPSHRQGDSAHYRTYVSTIAPASRWPESDSARTRGQNAALGRHLAFCGELARAAKTGGTAPQLTDGEEKLDLWRQRP